MSAFENVKAPILDVMHAANIAAAVAKPSKWIWRFWPSCCG
ncbi:MAG: hypothetical protein ACLRSW_02335 [Christensenellaceae bacterium]